MDNTPDWQAFWQRDTVTIKNLSHWQGYWTAYDRHGKAHREMVETLCRDAGEPLPKVIVEWGVGGGANAVHWPDADLYFGVDLSVHSLLEAEQRYDSKAFRPVRLYHDTVLWHTLDADLFLSTQTFQHFPSQDYAADITRKAWVTLRPGGVALIQTRVGDGRVTTYANDYTHYCTWPAGEYEAVALDAGFTVHYFENANGGDYEYWYLQKPYA
jgi:hypothetical protein